jgi:spermidine synthase
MLPEAKKYHAYARECLELAEQADSAEIRQKLIELSRVWMEAALREEGVLKPQSKAVRAS